MESDPTISFSLMVYANLGSPRAAPLPARISRALPNASTLRRSVWESLPPLHTNCTSGEERKNPLRAAPSSPLALGKFYQEPNQKTENWTEFTENRSLGSLFGSHFRGTEICSVKSVPHSVNRTNRNLLLCWLPCRLAIAWSPGWLDVFQYLCCAVLV